MKENKKISKTFTIDQDVFDEFRKTCEKNSINMSKFVQNKMIDFIKEHDLNATKK